MRIFHRLLSFDASPVTAIATGTLRRLALAFSLSGTALLVGCVNSGVPNLSGSWENDVVGTLNLTQTGNTVSAEQKDADFRAFFGPNMFEGSIKDGTLTGKVATALDMNLRATCGQNWGTWSDLELRVAPDGLALEGRWMRSTHDTAASGCPVTSSEWQPFRLTRGAGQLPVELNVVPQWVAALVLLTGLLVATGFRYALVNYLVGPMKRSPNTASSAGWALFAALLSGSAAIAATLAGPSFASPVVWGGFVGTSLVALMAAIAMCTRR